MNLKQLTKTILRFPKHILENVLGIRILKTLPRGLDFLHDARELPWPNEPTIIFDVGANTGQSAIPLSSTFPHSTIQCFEPSTENFRHLLTTTRNNKKITCHQLGVSESGGSASLVLSSDPTMHHMKASPEDSDHIENIQIVTLDDFCASHEFKHIDILKIDTEGHDLAVLLGANRLFSNLSVEVIYCEVSMNTANNFHASFEKIRQVMQHHGYYIFGIYEQTSEWTQQKPYLRRANIAFLSPALANRII